MTTTSTHHTRNIHARRQAHARWMNLQAPRIRTDLEGFYGGPCRAALWALMYVLRQADLSLPQIGAITGRHHTTVLHALSRIEANPTLQAELAPFVQEYATTRRTA